MGNGECLVDEEVKRAMHRDTRMCVSFATRLLGCVSVEQAHDALDEYAFAYARQLDVDLALLGTQDRVEFVDFARGVCGDCALELAKERGIAIHGDVEAEAVFARVRVVLLVDSGVVRRMLRAAKSQLRARAIVVELLAACGAAPETER